MPRTANRLLHDESLGKRASVMCTDGADREHVTTAPDKKHRLAACVPE